MTHQTLLQEITEAKQDLNLFEICLSTEMIFLFDKRR